MHPKIEDVIRILCTIEVNWIKQNNFQIDYWSKWKIIVNKMLRLFVKIHWNKMIDKKIMSNFF